MNELLHNVLLADWFSDLTRDMDHDQRFVLVIVGIGCATGIVCALSTFILHTINSMHRRRVEAELKREMLDRGMSPSDIATVIEAAGPPEDGTQRWIASWAKRSKSS
ncbi:MAG TPA: hypothetical protein VH107_20010 [Lacipirellulaceae bacterium]|nr:hypothetical protein [Lacipirellulaceae bacterium]